MTLPVAQITKPTLLLNTQEYGGGIAIWGALPPVFDTKKNPFDRGIHVHARLHGSRKKIIDATYSLVEVQHLTRSFIIEEDMAVMFSLASIFNLTIKPIACSNCNEYILSKGFFALIPHHEHLCTHCGSITLSESACVSNPIIAIKEHLNDGNIQRSVTIPMRSIHIEPNQCPGGVEIWGSNPSILWTADRLEESAIHVHAYNELNRRIIDNTYGEVYLGGKRLDIIMIRYLQIQQQFPEIRNHLNCIKCPSCDNAQFDQGIYAIIPQITRICQFCKLPFTTVIPSISNPVAEIINWYKELCHANNYH
jgi:hypothetical protein